jgi:hypothetical protein
VRILLRKVRFVRHVEGFEDMTNAHKVYVCKPEAKRWKGDTGAY